MSSSFVKDIIVARAGRNFRNGKQAFDLTVENIDEVIGNFDRLKKQVPLLLTPDHIFGGRKSAIPAAGWVERMYRDGDAWHAVCKFVGEAATLVANDQFRGVSIGTIMAHDVHGKPVGEALDHLLITNSPFFSGLNIAARIAATTSPAVEIRYICSERSVPDAVAHPIDYSGVKNPFVEMECARCGRGFETQNPTTRFTCDACTGQLTVPKPDPKPAAAPPIAPVAPIPKPVGRPMEAGPDSNPSRGDRLSHLVPGAIPARAAAGTTRPEMTKRLDVSDSFIGNAGPKPEDLSPLQKDPEYQAALHRLDSEALARITADFGKRNER